MSEILLPFKLEVHMAYIHFMKELKAVSSF